MDKLLKDHIMLMFGVKKRTLQDWLRAGLIPNTTRTKGGHYRIRAPKGMTADIYSRAVEIFTNDPSKGEQDGVKRLGQQGRTTNAWHMVKAAKDAGVPESWWDWQLRIAKNVKHYNAFMRPLRRHCRGKVSLPFYRLDDFKNVSLIRERERRAWSKRA